jgi:general L-amino acid transport system permease protein
MTSTPASGFVRAQIIAPAPPPRLHVSLPAWIRGRLFNSIGNSILTVLGIVGLAALAWPTIRFLLLDAVWRGAQRTDCLTETVGREVGACWPFIAAKFDQLMYGFYPAYQRWRVDLVYLCGALLLAPLLVPRVPYKALNAVLFFGVFPLAAAVLLVGGVLGLTEVETRRWLFPMPASSDRCRSASCWRSDAAPICRWCAAPAWSSSSSGAACR